MVLPVVVLAAAAMLAYANTFSVPFLFDDTAAVVGNPTIRHLWPPWSALFTPAGGDTTAGRPIVNLSLAISYAISGSAVWSYHALNLAIHLCAALALFGLVRRTLLLPRLSDRFPASANFIAFVAALLWVLHPLQTESVTYVVQRAEALVSLFYLLTLYAFVRRIESPRPLLWSVLSVLSCALGMASKEVMVSAPLIVLCYDRTFVAGSFGASWRERRGYYVGLAVTWLVLGGLLIQMGGGRGDSAGFGHGIPWWAYAFAQAPAVSHYLRLVFWPHPLIFDYGIAVVYQALAILPQLLLVAALVAGTLFAWSRRWMIGFAGVFFFAVLAPSSSVVPVNSQTMAEHRMYLALAATLVPLVIGLCTLAGRRGLFAGLALAVAWGATTFRRNDDYQSESRIWHDTLVKLPTNPRAFDNYGLALSNRQQWPEAVRVFTEALRLNPGSASSREGLGAALFQLGRLAEARTLFEEAIRQKPDSPAGHRGLTGIFFKTGDTAGALREAQECVRLEPNSPPAYRRLGIALYQVGRLADAIPAFEKAIQLNPKDAFAHQGIGAVYFSRSEFDAAIPWLAEAVRLMPELDTAREPLARALLNLRRYPEAIAQYEQMLRATPEVAELHHRLGTAYAEIGDAAKATLHYQHALRLEPNRFDTHFNFGNLLFNEGQTADAIQHYRETVRLQPDQAQLRMSLANALLRANDLAAATTEYHEALRLDPALPVAVNNLGVILLRAGRPTEAIPHFERALQLDPNYAAARENLARVRATPPTQSAK